MISKSALNSKLRAWMKTPAGQSRTKSYIDGLRQRDGVTAGGHRVVGLATMCKLADELVRMVKESAKASGAADAIMDEINSLQYVYTDLGDGQYYFEFRFVSDTHRDSMMPKLYPNGIDNIIALFNAGYVAENPRWANVSGPPHMRPSLMFMQDAITKFTNKYGGKYNLQVELNPIYTDGNWMVTSLNK